MKLPESFEQKMKELLKDEFEDYIKCFDDPHFGGLRVNTLKITTEEFEKICPFQIKKIPWVPNGYFYNLEDQPARHPYYFAGLYYIQEPSAMTPASLLPVEPGDKVLDLCAAPGGKTTELGAKLKDQGVLVCNDISNSRAKALLKNVELIGVRNATVVSEAPNKLAKCFEGYFDKILVDAPCSGEGMFRKQPAIMKNWEQYGVDYYNKLQKDIILDAARMLKKGGLMIYSTCTFSPEENEGTVKFLKENFEDFHVVDALAVAKEIYQDKVDYTGFAPGHPEWADAPEEVKECIRLWPHKINGEGHFVTLLRKGELEKTEQKVAETKKIDVAAVMKKSKVSLPEETVEFLNTLNIKLDEGEFKLRKDMLYYVPSQLTDNFGLRTLRHGLLLGEMKKNRFEPSQALASSMRIGDYDQVVNLSVDNPSVIKYLKCETIELKEEELLPIPVTGEDGITEYKIVVPKNGWVLICVDSFPLGWGKLSGGSIKNKYLSGWRWM